MKKFFSSLLVAVVTSVAIFVGYNKISNEQAYTPYITKLISFNLPLRNTDSSVITDLEGINVYYSFEGETNFTKGVESLNFLTYVPINLSSPYTSISPAKPIGEAKIGSSLVVGAGKELTVRELIKWDGSFDNSNVWVRATAVDTYGNESDFSDFSSGVLSNVNLTEEPKIVKFKIRNKKVELWIDSSNGQEVIEVAKNLLSPAQGIGEAKVGSTLIVGANGESWVYETYPLKIIYDLDEFNLISSTGFFRIRR